MLKRQTWASRLPLAHGPRDCKNRNRHGARPNPFLPLPALESRFLLGVVDGQTTLGRS